MNLKELRELREAKRKELGRREAGGKRVQIIVGMGTCGVAAGAKRALDAFLDELGRHNRNDVVVKPTGCMGLCHAEPTVEVLVPGMPTIIYGKVDEETARQIVRAHILGGALVDHHVYDRPAADIVEGAAEHRAAGGARPAAAGARGGK